MTAPNVDIWITQDEREIPVTKMTDQHIQHAWRLFSAKLTTLILLGEPEEGMKALKRFIQRRRNNLKRDIEVRLAMLRREITRRGLEVEGV